jgi:hypothetical protein
MRGLSGPEIGILVGLVDDLFDPDDLDMMLRIRLDKKFRNLHKGGTYQKQVFDAVLKANAEGWVPRLMEAMVASRPENAELRSLAATVGTIAPDVYRKDMADKAPEGFLEKFVKAGNLVKWTGFTENLLRVQRTVCSIKLSGDRQSYGTGILVGPDLILTNHHVVQPLLADDGAVTDVHFRFDYATADPERDYHLSADKVNIIAKRAPAEPAIEQGDLTAGRPAEALDYALLKLPARLGDEPFGPKTDNPALASLPARGHLPAPASAPRIRAEADLFIAQHPNGRSLRIGVGQILEVSPDGTRFRYNTNTDSGSSGAPCFNAKMEWVGIHHYGSEEGGFNQGIPLGAILADLQSQGIDLTETLQ